MLLCCFGGYPCCCGTLLAICTEIADHPRSIEQGGATQDRDWQFELPVPVFFDGWVNYLWQGVGDRQLWLIACVITADEGYIVCMTVITIICSKAQAELRHTQQVDILASAERQVGTKPVTDTDIIHIADRHQTYGRRRRCFVEVGQL